VFHDTKYTTVTLCRLVSVDRFFFFYRASHRPV
jgi:hypothetical protein